MELYTLLALTIVPVLAGALAHWLVPIAGRLGVRWNIVDRPRPGEIQVQAVPRTGGYAIFGAFLVALGLSVLAMPRFPEEYPRLMGVLLGALVILPVAVLDDTLRLGPLPQLLGQAIIASIPMLFGVMVDSVANPFGGVVALPGWVVVPLTLFWFLGMINTLNFVDTADGLAAGVAGIAALVLAIRSLQLEQYSIAVLVLALAGVCGGFLPHNLHPARVFMGTSGSLFLGYSLAALAILGGAKIATTMMVLAVPILDTGLVIWQRVRAGRSPFRGGDFAHLPHRLLAMGIPLRAVVFMLYGLCLALGILSLALSAVQKLYTLIGAVVILVGVGAFAAYRTGTTHPEASSPEASLDRASEPAPRRQT